MTRLIDRLRPTAIIFGALIVSIVWVAFHFSSTSLEHAFTLLQSDLADDVRQGALTLVGHATAMALAMAAITAIGGALGKLVEPPATDIGGEIAQALIARMTVTVDAEDASDLLD